MSVRPLYHFTLIKYLLVSIDKAQGASAANHVDAGVDSQRRRHVRQVTRGLPVRGQALIPALTR